MSESNERNYIIRTQGGHLDPSPYFSLSFPRWTSKQSKASRMTKAEAEVRLKGELLRCLDRGLYRARIVRLRRRSSVEVLGKKLQAAIEAIPPGRQRALALTSLETVLWRASLAEKGI